MFDGTRKKKKSKFINQSNLNILKTCIKVGYELVKSSSLQQEIQEEERIHRKYLEYKKQPLHFNNSLEKVITLLSIVVCTIFLVVILCFLELIKNGFVIFGLVIYMFFAINFFFSVLSASLNVKNRIVITEQDRKVLERRKERKEAELLEDYRRKQEEEEKRQAKDKQYKILGIFTAIAAVALTSQLNKSNQVYVRGHYRNKPKRKVR